MDIHALERKCFKHFATRKENGSLDPCPGGVESENADAVRMRSYMMNIHECLDSRLMMSPQLEVAFRTMAGSTEKAKKLSESKVPQRKITIKCLETKEEAETHRATEEVEREKTAESFLGRTSIYINKRNQVGIIKETYDASGKSEEAETQDEPKREEKYECSIAIDY